MINLEYQTLSGCPICQNIEALKPLYEANYSQLLPGEQNFAARIECCEHCGFVFQNPRLNANSLAAYYNYETFSMAYERGTREIPEHLKFRFVRSLYFLNELGFTPEKNLVDIGTHKGQFLKFLNDAGFRNVEGFDLSQDCAKLGLEWYNARIAAGSLEEYAGSISKRFKAVTAFHLVEHLADFSAFFGQIDKMLDDDGILLIEVPDLMRIPEDYVNYFFIEHLSYFTKPTLSALLAQFGFELIEHKTIPQEFPDDQSREMPSQIAAFCRSSRISSDALQGLFAEGRASIPHIRQQVADLEIKRLDLIQRLESTKAYSKVFLWGSGSHTHYLFGLSDLSHVSAVVDSSPSRWGKRVHGLEVISPEDLVANSKGNDAIIVSSFSAEAAIVRAAKRLLPQSVIVPLYQPNEMQ
jgi:2-polyprenyl-3-methyl-5-hydroxy-6-metoxy-1,4-benzoquinol methylase